MKAINQRQPQSKKIKIDSREITFVDKLTVLLRRFAHKIIKLDVDIYILSTRFTCIKRHTLCQKCYNNSSIMEKTWVLFSHSKKNKATNKKSQ